MRIIILVTAILTALSVTAQRAIVPTDSLIIQGKIKNQKIFTLPGLDTFPKTIIKDQIIYNQRGEEKGTLKNMQGVSLKTILSSIEFEYDKPKDLNEFYFVFIASDGYKVVFSWNEIYNNEAGNNFFIVTEMEGKKLKEIEHRIIFISAADLKAGRRYIKGLERIDVKRVD